MESHPLTLLSGCLSGTSGSDIKVEKSGQKLFTG